MMFFNFLQQVRSDSPLFALDCEFKQKKALDILSMVNECGQVVYRTDVAEANHHKYCSLIECTECRKPSIEDVQQHLIHYLPPDAILVGHSISSDLGALKVGMASYQGSVGWVEECIFIEYY